MTSLKLLVEARSLESLLFKCIVFSNLPPALFSFPLSLPPNAFMSSLNGPRSLPPCVSFFSLLPDHFGRSLLPFLWALSSLLSVSFLILEVLSLPPHDVLCQPLSLQRLRPLPCHHFLSPLPNYLSLPLSSSLDCSPVLQAAFFNSPTLLY